MLLVEHFRKYKLSRKELKFPRISSSVGIALDRTDLQQFDLKYSILGQRERDTHSGRISSCGSVFFHDTRRKRTGSSGVQSG